MAMHGAGPHEHSIELMIPRKCSRLNFLIHRKSRNSVNKSGNTFGGHPVVRKDLVRWFVYRIYEGKDFSSYESLVTGLHSQTDSPTINCVNFHFRYLLLGPLVLTLKLLS